jgi:hypothetical protein
MAEPTYLPGKTCPKCNEPLTGASTVFGEQVDPTPGDVSICIHCLTLLTYNDDLTSRVLEIVEFLGLPDDTRLELTRALKALIEVQSGDT